MSNLDQHEYLQRSDLSSSCGEPSRSIPEAQWRSLHNRYGLQQQPRTFLETENATNLFLPVRSFVVPDVGHGNYIACTVLQCSMSNSHGTASEELFRSRSDQMSAGVRWRRVCDHGRREPNLSLRIWPLVRTCRHPGGTARNRNCGGV